MKNLEDDDYSEGDKEKEFEEIKNKILKYLSKKEEEGEKEEEKEKEKVYLISSKRDFRDKYDFPKLREDMLKSLPDLKQEVLLRTLKAITKGILEGKKIFLRKRLFWYSAASGAAGAVPVPGLLNVSVDIGIFGAMTKEQNTQLGISAADLEEAAKDLGFSSREELLKYLAKGINDDQEPK